MNYWLFLAAVDFFSAPAHVWAVRAFAKFSYLRCDSFQTLHSSLRHICYPCSKQCTLPTSIDSKDYVTHVQSPHGWHLMANYQDWFKLQRLIFSCESRNLLGIFLNPRPEFLKKCSPRYSQCTQFTFFDESLSFPPQTALLIISCLALFTPHSTG